MTMARRIFKYPIEIENRQIIQMPKGARILHAERQGEFPVLWASVDPAQPVEPRVFRMVTTGEIFNEERLAYVGTIQLGGNRPLEAWFVMHLYEVETALEQINPDPIEGRFQEDLEEIKHEIAEVDERRVAA